MNNTSWKKEEIRRGQQLVTAAGNGNLPQIIELLEEGASVNAEEYNKSLFYASRNYMTPLQMACEKGYADIVKFLVNCNGVDLNSRDRFDVTAVHIAAEKGYEDCLRELIDAGAECSVPTKHSKKGSYTAIPHPGGTTPLHLAATNNHISCVVELIQAGADYNAIDERGRTSMYIAAQQGLEECVLAHLKNAVGRDILSLPSIESGDTPLHFAVKHGMVECVKELVSLGSDPNHLNHAGLSPLHYAVSINPEIENCCEEMLHLLVLKGYNINVNVEDGSGFTPLHYVCFNAGVSFIRRPKLASFLISYGADPNIKNQRGFSLIEYEMKSGDVKNQSILKAIVQSMLHIPPYHSLRIGSANTPGRVPSPPFPHYAHPRFFGAAADRIEPNVDIEQHRLHLEHRVYLELLREQGELFNEREFPQRYPPYRVRYPLSTQQHIEMKHHWYISVASQPRTLQHHCRCKIRSALGPRRMRHIKDLNIPVRLQKYLLLETDEL